MSGGEVRKIASGETVVASSVRDFVLVAPRHREVENEEAPR
ncbi:MAG TPA: hypothetical protein VHR65_01695 [Solirubrobacterales bacterium]|jgi:hypothetical protein|nr:hypothetical protein [Solirubrobacterales bacterium]